MGQDEEQSFANILRIMEERSILNHTMAHGVFVGPPRSGKNSVMERLLGKMPSKVSVSTGVLESSIQVEVVQMTATVAANIEESEWSVMDYDDEAIRLMVLNINYEHECSSNSVSQEYESQAQCHHSVTHTVVQSSTAQTSRLRNLRFLGAPLYFIGKALKKVSKSNSVTVAPTQRNQPTEKRNPGECLKQLSEPSIPPSEIRKQALRNKGGLKALQQHFQKTWSLYLTNTGGQMEFQEVLPLVVSGPSLFFFTFRLGRRLDERYMVEYQYSGGTSSELYKSTLTTIEGLLQTLASIAAMGTFTYDGLQKRSVPLRPKVFLIGTHKDQLDEKTADKDINQIDQELKDVICSTEHYKHLVRFASQTRLIFAVNNFSMDESEFKMIRSAVELVVEQEDFEMTSPSHWLILSLAIRKYASKTESPVIGYDDCFEIAKQCMITDEKEFDLALNFIHSKMGLIR